MKKKKSQSTLLQGAKMAFLHCCIIMMLFVIQSRAVGKQSNSALTKLLRIQTMKKKSTTTAKVSAIVTRQLTKSCHTPRWRVVLNFSSTVRALTNKPTSIRSYSNHCRRITCNWQVHPSISMMRSSLRRRLVDWLTLYHRCQIFLAGFRWTPLTSTSWQTMVTTPSVLN